MKTKARVKCQCGEGITLNIRSSGTEKERRCWKCLTDVKIELVGQQVKAYLRKFMTFEWVETSEVTLE
jgi:hypothetical protein